MKNIVVFLDLDDTIFQTKRKCNSENSLTPVTFGIDGNPISYMKPGQLLLWESLLQIATLIPVTARDIPAFKRVNLNFNNGAIVDHGGIVILPTGDVDQEWLSYITPKSIKSDPLLKEAVSIINDYITKERLKARVRIVSDCNLNFYIVSKTDQDCLDELTYLSEILKKHFSQYANVYLNDNNLSFLPLYLNKSLAVEYFIKSNLKLDNKPKEKFLLLGMGDSISDTDFLDLCDYQIVPTKSQLGKRL